jgi:hypothetical protein
MKSKMKNLSLVSGVVVVAVTLGLLVTGLITRAGMITASAIAVISSIFLYLAGSKGTGERLKASHLKATFTLAMAITGVIPALFLILSTLVYTGIEHFLAERMVEFVWTELVALFYLTLAALLYRQNRGETVGLMIRKSLFSLLTLSFAVRLFWISFMETRHIVNFAAQYPQFAIEYVVLVSIPLFIALFVTSLFNLRIGYQVSVVLGIIHVLLVSFLVVMGISPGFGPIIVIASSLGISIFSALELRKSRANVASFSAS